MRDLQGYDIQYLRDKLNKYEYGVRQRYKWYEMQENMTELSIVTPKPVNDMYKATLGWCEKAVESLADRLVFREFENDQFDVNEIFKYNNADIFFDSAIQSALISSCCFVHITKSKNSQYPRLEILEGYNATGVIDPMTGLLKVGYAVLERDVNGVPTLEAFFEPDKTTYYYNGYGLPAYNQIVLGENIPRNTPLPINDVLPNKNIKPVEFKHNAGQCLLVPIIYRPDAKRPFGRSRITKSCIYHQRHAKRTLQRAEVTAEFYSFPQKYVVGTDPNNEPLDSWRAAISTVIEITKGEDGEKPTLGQFTTPSMAPFIDQLRMSAQLFAGETGLTPEDLGFVQDNPSSVEAIQASHETLRLMARKAQRNFSVNFKNVGYVAKCLQDEFAYGRNAFVDLKAKWEPIFEPTAGALSTMGDATIKINQAIPNYFDGEAFRDFTGIEGAKNAT